jgi:hypothetical protein
MRLRLRMTSWLGSLLNSLELPGFIRAGNQTSKATGVLVSVRFSSLYSIVSVNGIDVYFHRLTGRIACVGLKPAFDTPTLEHSGAPRLRPQLLTEPATSEAPAALWT